MTKEKTLVEMTEIAKLCNLLNSIAAQLQVTREDLNRAVTRLKASENSCLNIQASIIKHLNEIRTGI